MKKQSCTHPKCKRSTWTNTTSPYKCYKHRTKIVKQVREYKPKSFGTYSEVKKKS